MLCSSTKHAPSPCLAYVIDIEKGDRVNNEVYSNKAISWHMIALLIDRYISTDK